MKIDDKCNKTVKHYPNRIYSKERRPQFNLDRNKHRGEPRCSFETQISYCI